jgi:hypothetical protein
MGAGEGGRPNGNGIRVALDMVREQVKRLDDRLSKHENECAEERREAARQRHDFRAEVALSNNKLHERISKNAEAANSKLDELLEKRHSDREQVLGRVIWLLGGALSLAGIALLYFLMKGSLFIMASPPTPL